MTLTKSQQKIFDRLRKGPISLHTHQPAICSTSTLRVQILRMREKGLPIVTNRQNSTYELVEDFKGTADDAIDYAILRADTVFLADWKAGDPGKHYLQWLKERYS